MRGRLLLLPPLLALSALWADPAEEYASRASKLDDKDAAGWMGLANFCEDRLLFKESERCLRKAVEGGHQ